jgi:hypothetical protein
MLRSRVIKAFRQPSRSDVPALGLILIYRGPWLRRDSRIRPVGRAAGCRAFFDQHKDVLSKNPAKHADPARSAGRNQRGVLSLGHSFFAQAKKGGSLATASETKGRTDTVFGESMPIRSVDHPSNSINSATTPTL